MEMEVMAGGGRRFLKASGTESLPSVWANPGVLRSKSWVEYVPPGEKGEDKSLQLWRRKRGETVMSDQVWIAQVFSSDAEHREWVCLATRRTWRVPGGHRGAGPHILIPQNRFMGKKPWSSPMPVESTESSSELRVSGRELGRGLRTEVRRVDPPRGVWGGRCRTTGW